MTSRRRRTVVAALCFTALLGAVACGDDGGNAATGAGELSADERRYCELAAEIEAQAEEAFSGLPEDASEEEVAETQQSLLADIDDELDELVEVAPEEISADVAAFAASFRASLQGDDSEMASDERIVAWEEANCPS